MNARPAEFDAMVLQWQPLMYKVARKLRPDTCEYDLEDLVQATNLAALAAWENYRPEESFPAWLVWRMRGVLADLKRRTRAVKRQGLTMSLDDAFDVGEPASQEDALYAKQILARVGRIRHSDLLIRVALGDAQADIAEERGVSRQAINQSVASGRAALAKFRVAL